MRSNERYMRGLAQAREEQVVAAAGYLKRFNVQRFPVGPKRARLSKPSTLAMSGDMRPPVR